MISLQAVRNGTGECKLLIIDHGSVILTSHTFLMDQFWTTTIVWGRVITLLSDTVYHVTLQVSGYLYTRKILLNSCSTLFLVAY